MNMQALDWGIVIGLLIVLVASAISTAQYSKSVSAFLAAERCGGRYLISVSNGMSQLGVITMVVWFQIHYDVGFTGFWWGLINEPVFMMMALTGWVIFRFRQTRAMTLAQFFEMRYSRSFRVFSGLVAFLAGILNFGIFPSVGARFFISLCNLPETFIIPGLGMTASTYVSIMVFLLVSAVYFTFLGGQIAIMVTDFIQGIFNNIVFVIIILFLLLTFSKSQMSESLLDAESGKSLVNPFDLANESNFNPFYFIIAAITVFYAAKCWQGSAGYNCAARNPHEARMAEILGIWRWRVMLPIIFISFAVSIHVFLEHPAWQSRSQVVHQRLQDHAGWYLNTLSKESNDFQQDLGLLAGLSMEDSRQLLQLTDKKVEEISPQMVSQIKGIQTSDPKRARLLARLLHDKTEEVTSQARMPMTLGAVLPVGLLGLFCASMVAAFIGSHDTYMHSWGSMLIQDVILPFRKTPLSPQKHLRWLKISILAVAVYIFIFSLFFQHSQRVVMYCNITAAVFVGGAGAVIIGGLYWKKATAAGAWTAMIAGLTLSLAGTLITQAGVSALYAAKQQPFWVQVTKILSAINADQFFWAAAEIVFKTNAQVITFWVYTICVVLFVTVSLLTHKQDFNMDKMLHRGQYAIAGEESASYADATTVWQKLGISSDFKGFDYFIAAITVAWPMFWITVFIVVSLIHKTLTDTWWFEYWYNWMWVIFGLCVVFTLWFTIGGCIDMKNLYKHLKAFEANRADDGRVTDPNMPKPSTDDTSGIPETSK